MRGAWVLVAGLTLAACGGEQDCSDLVGSWEGRLGTVVIKKVAAKRFSLDFPSGRSIDLQCKAGVLAGDSPIRASRNAAGKLVLDGFPGGEIETFARLQ